MPRRVFIPTTMPVLKLNMAAIVINLDQALAHVIIV